MGADEEHDNQNADAKGPVNFSLSAAREVFSILCCAHIDSEDSKKKAILSSLAEYGRQLNSIEAIYRTQTKQALEFGLHGALAEGCCADAIGNAAGLASDPHTLAAAMPEVFSVTDGFIDREHIRALAYQATCPQEAVRKELRAFQKAVSDRLSLAAKRAKAQGQDPPPPPPTGVRSTPAFCRLYDGATGSDASAAATAAAAQTCSPGTQHLEPPNFHPRRQQHRQQQGAAAAPVAALVAAFVDEQLYRWDEMEEELRKTQLAKLGSLLNLATGGINASPISVVGQFQQRIAAYVDWRVRRAALEAMGRSSPEVLWRLLQNSRVLDCLYGWLQEALADHQMTMLQMMLDTMACLPMRRDLLKGSKLEAALEVLAGVRQNGGASAAGAAAAAADDVAVNMRQRFGAAAAVVLAGWRRDPDRDAILRRSGVAVSEPPIATAAMRKVGQAPPVAAAAAGGAHTPGSRLLGAAAAARDGRKRALAMPRPPGDARSAPRPRLMGAPPSITAAAAAGYGSGVSGAPGSSGGGIPNGSGGARGYAAIRVNGGGAGLSGGTAGAGLAKLKCAAVTAAGSLPKEVDMTAKLGEKGAADPDLIAGFKVRRSQLTTIRLTTRVVPGAVAAPPPPAGPAAHPARETSPCPAKTGAGAAAAAAVDTAAGAAAPLEASSSGGSDATMATLEVAPDEVARLRADRAAQRQAAALLALRAEARRHPEVSAAEREHQERSRAAAEQRRRRPLPEEEVVRRRLAAMRETTDWLTPPPELLLPPDHTPAGIGEESTERLDRALERQGMAKVRYGIRVPDSPAEPLGARQQQHPPAAAARAFPWLPLAESGESAADLYRQNVALWEKGVRRSDFVLPPVLLHTYLELPPEMLDPRYAVHPSAVSPVPPAATAAGGSPVPGTAAHRPPLIQSQPLPYEHIQQPHPQSYSQQHRPPAAAAGAAAAPPPPLHHLSPMTSVQIMTAWDRPGAAPPPPSPQQQPQQQLSLLSQPGQVLVLSAVPAQAVAPAPFVSLMAIPPQPPLQMQSQPPVQPHPTPHLQQHQAPLLPLPPLPQKQQQQQPVSYEQAPFQHDRYAGTQQLYEFGNGTNSSVPYSYRGKDGWPPTHAKQQGQREQHYHEHQQNPPRPAYQQPPEPGGHNHYGSDPYGPYGHRQPSLQDGHGGAARGDGGGVDGGGGGGDRGQAYGGYFSQKQRESDSEGWRQPWEYGERV